MTDQSRRAFFRNAFKGAVKSAKDVVFDEVVAQVDKRLPPQRRPPGALEEMAFVATCDKCHKCVDACPPPGADFLCAIYTLPLDGTLTANTPVMVPQERACLMCDGWPCAQACPTGALLPPLTSTVALGTARIREDLCFVFRGPECGACANLCPADAPALTLRLGRPSIDAEVCVGCGQCIVACPMTPKAIDLDPVLSLSNV